MMEELKEIIQESECEENIYNDQYRADLIDNDEINAQEEGFMGGYLGEEEEEDDNFNDESTQEEDLLI